MWTHFGARMYIFAVWRCCCLLPTCLFALGYALFALFTLKLYRVLLTCVLINRIVSAILESVATVTHTVRTWLYKVYPKKYAHGFVVLCFVVVTQSFIMNSHEVFIHIYQGCFAGTGAIVRLPQCQWSKPDGHGKISQNITTTKHSKAKTVCIFLGIYCMIYDCFGLSCVWWRMGWTLCLNCIFINYFI